MNWFKRNIAKWLLGKAVVEAGTRAEEAIGKVPQSQRSTVLGVILWVLFIAKNAYALFDGDPATHLDVQPDVIDAILAGQGTAFMMMREQRAHEEEKRLRAEMEKRIALQ